MAKKEYKTTTRFKYFKSRSPKCNAESAAASISSAAKEAMAGYNIDVWGTITKIEESLKKSWDYNYDDCHFRRWWLDQLVDEWSYLIWNTIFDADRKNGDDKKSDLHATDVVTKFTKSFC